MVLETRAYDRVPESRPGKHNAGPGWACEESRRPSEKDDGRTGGRNLDQSFDGEEQGGGWEIFDGGGFGLHGGGHLHVQK